MRSPAPTVWPRISVVTPSYNHGRFLDTTITSVLSQDYPPFEYLVLDGGSTDDTPQIIRRYANRLTYWTSAPDAGQAAALNAGITRATGDVIGWINSDDFYLPGALRAAARCFADHPDTVLVYGDCYAVDEGASVLHRIRPGPFSLERLARRCFLMQMSTLFRRDVIERIGGVDPDLKYAIDYDLWLRIARTCQHQIRYLPVVLSCYRIHSQSQSSRDQLPALCEEIAVRRKFLTQADLPRTISSFRDGFFREPLCRLLASAQDPAVRPIVTDYLRRTLTTDVFNDDEWRALWTCMSAAWVDPACEEKGWEIALRLDRRWTYTLAGVKAGEQKVWLASLLMLLGYGHVRKENFSRAIRMFARCVMLDPCNLLSLDYWYLTEAGIRRFVSDATLQALRRFKRRLKSLYYGFRSPATCRWNLQSGA